MAGFYTLNADITAGDQEAEIEGIITFEEENIVTTTSRDFGLIVTTKIIEKIQSEYSLTDFIEQTKTDKKTPIKNFTFN